MKRPLTLSIGAALVFGAFATVGCGNEQTRSQSEMKPETKAAFEQSHMPGAQSSPANASPGTP
jgi:hypothetical protein